MPLPINSYNFSVNQLTMWNLIPEWLMIRMQLRSIKRFKMACTFTYFHNRQILLKVNKLIKFRSQVFVVDKWDIPHPLRKRSKTQIICVAWQLKHIILAVLLWSDHWQPIHWGWTSQSCTRHYTELSFVYIRCKFAWNSNVQELNKAYMHTMNNWQKSHLEIYIKAYKSLMRVLEKTPNLVKRFLSRVKIL